LYEIQGLDLELRGAPEDSIHAAYERAVALEPRSADALAGLGRLALERSPDEALALFDRAAAADPSQAEPRREAAAILAASGRAREAEERLEALLGAHPTDAAAAARSVELRLARDVSDDRTLELARRAVRFGGRAEALDLLSRVYQQRDDPERARNAAADAKRLRERRAAAADGSSTPSSSSSTPSTSSTPSPEGAKPAG
jgi:tetratricopeptide (TPR) repeat protein